MWGCRLRRPCRRPAAIGSLTNASKAQREAAFFLGHGSEMRSLHSPLLLRPLLSKSPSHTLPLCSGSSRLVSQGGKGLRQSSGVWLRLHLPLASGSCQAQHSSEGARHRVWLPFSEGVGLLVPEASPHGGLRALPWPSGCITPKGSGWQED